MSKKLDNTTTRWVNYPGAKLFSQVSVHIGSNELQFIRVLGEHQGEAYQLQIDHEEFGSIWKPIVMAGELKCVTALRYV